MSEYQPARNHELANPRVAIEIQTAVTNPGVN